MIKIYINQKKNNIFLNIFFFKKNIYYMSIGLLKEKKIINFSLIDLILSDMFIFLKTYIEKKFIIFNKNLYFNLKTLININVFFSIFSNFDDFLSPVLTFFIKELDLKFNVFFLNKFSFGTKIKKKNIKLKKKRWHKS